MTVCATLACPIVACVNAICAGLALRPDAAIPAPLNATATAFTPNVEDETVSVAAFPPVAVGVKITCTVQLLPLFSVAPHVVVPVVKLPAAGPVIWKPTFAIADPPLLLTVSASGELAAPTCCAGKFKLDGLTPIAGGARPAPESATVCVRNASETVNMPVCAPAAVGANTTPIEQLAFAANCAPQLLVT